jgi:hypothetical protein
MRETDPVNEAKEAFRVFDAEGFGFIGKDLSVSQCCFCVNIFRIRHCYYSTGFFTNIIFCSITFKVSAWLFNQVVCKIGLTVKKPVEVLS